MFCTNCGKEIEDSVNFCGFCGAKVNGKEAVSVTDNALISQVQNARNVINKFYEYLYMAKDMELNSYCYKRALWHLSAFSLFLGRVKTVLYVMSAVIGGLTIALSYNLIKYFSEVNLEKYNILCYAAILLSILVIVLPNAVIIHKGKKYKKNELEIKKMAKDYIEEHGKELGFLSVEYMVPEAINYIAHMLEEGRVTTLHQAYDKYDAKDHPNRDTLSWEEGIAYIYADTFQ